MARKNSIRSIRELAAAIGRSKSTVAGWLRDDRWPFARRAPWPDSDVPRIKQWAAVTLEPSPGAPPPAAPGKLGPERAVKVLLAKERVEAQKIANQLKRGELHRVDECQARRVRQIIAVKQRLLSVAGNLAQRIGLSPDVERAIHDEMVSICNEFARDPRQ